VVRHKYIFEGILADAFWREKKVAFLGLSLVVWKPQGSVHGSRDATMTLGSTICQTQFSVFVWYWWRHHQKKRGLQVEHCFYSGKC
jgi:hypothetical protein